MKLNVAICFTPGQVRNMVTILNSTDKSFLIFNTSNKKIDHKLSFEVSGVFQTFIIFQFLRFFFKVGLIDLNSVIYAHPYHFITNWFYQASSTGVCLEDGLANYYNANEPPMDIVRNIRRKSTFLLYKFCKPKDEGLIPLSCCFVAGYFRFKDYVFTICGVYYQLNSNFKCNMKLNNIVLFLDQDIDRLEGNFELRCKMVEILEEYLRLGYDVLIKRHHDDLSNFHYGDYQEYNGLESAENLVNIIAPSTVISYTSSALMNIKGEHSNVNVVSVGSKLIKLDGLGCLSDFYQKFNICIVDVYD